MTIVAGVSRLVDAVVIADTRLSRIDTAGRPVIVRDICQKLVAANGWSIVGFAGDLCLGRDLLGGVVSRLRDTQYDRPNWLKDDETLLRFIRDGVTGHLRLNANHRPCQKRPVELLVVWMDYTRSIWAGDHQPGDERWVPGVELLVIQTPGMSIRRTRLGLDIIGSGAVIRDTMQRDAFLKILSFAIGQDQEQPYRCQFTSVVVRDLLSDVGVPTVGGLYQMASIGQEGVAVWPYFYWAPVEPGYGTYVAMRIENGNWVQEHRPTGTKVRVVNPFDIQLRGPKWVPGQHEMFDPARTLTRHSPGVLPQSNVRIEFSPYDPARVSGEIRQSWGEDPLTPLSWGQSQPRRRRRRRW